MKSVIVLFSGLFLLSNGFLLLETDPPDSREALGKLLFFEKKLSKDKTISCASCHKPEFAFADTTALSKGVGGKLGTRNTPSVMNMASRPYFFYDGRAATLEEQAKGPIENPVEMNLKYSEAVKRIQKDKKYKAYFQEVYGNPPDSANILDAIAAFITSLESDGSAPNDRWLYGEEAAMTESQVRGREVFLEKGKCFDCHFSPDFTGDEFRNIGLFDGHTLKDKGRFDFTKDPADLGKFKTPGLRNVALTAPYMHNGMFKTLEEVVDYYDKPDAVVKNPINRDSLLAKPLGLTKQEKSDLVNYLHALSDGTMPFPKVAEKMK
jgi:cytochrome c peroxidase